MGQTVEDIRERLAHADAAEFAVLERTLRADARKGVVQALAVARRRLARDAAEEARLAGMYDFQTQVAGGRLLMGLDEVGRGPLAGPLTVAAVVLADEPRIAGLDDSKRVAPQDRERIASEVKEKALAWSIRHIEPEAIDAAGMSACLRVAFSRAVKDIDDSGLSVEAVLLDGNPLRFDEREINVIKGDGRCASIAAASIIAKVERDALMRAYAAEYPLYGFEKNKGYASTEHQRAIALHGLTPLHRATFCSAFTQEALF